VTDLRAQPARRTAPAPFAERVVDHSAIAHNVRVLLERAGRPVMAVVKADAFGHGAVEVATTALAAGATWLGVATVDEALRLRAAGFECPVFAWLVDPWSDLDAAIRLRVTLSCPNIETLEAIVDASARVGGVASVHLEIDTGMARGGATASDWNGLCRAARAAEARGGIRVEGVWSHLALASDPGPSSVARALAEFDAGVAVARGCGLHPSELHIANSAGALAHPETRMSMVRAGAAVYGIETVVGERYGLRAAMRVTSRVIQLRRVGAGTGVGYHHSFVTAADAALALVPIGYGDGVPRALSHGGRVVIGGRSFAIRGLISMDQLVVEVDSGVRLGDEVVLVGSAPGDPSIAEWSAVASTIPHELLTGFGARVALRHIRD
jgi:alanine racemase